MDKPTFLAIPRVEFVAGGGQMLDEGYKGNVIVFMGASTFDYSTYLLQIAGARPMDQFAINIPGLNGEDSLSMSVLAFADDLQKSFPKANIIRVSSVKELAGKYPVARDVVKAKRLSGDACVPPIG